MSRKRPTPERFLQQASEAERHVKRGKLKIYIGAAPGVGKTHEMLEDALQARNKGLDVVIGIVESHGRTEIEKLREQFEILPKQMVSYHQKELAEFDLDGTLARNPGLVLVDELAHTNVPGLRHEKRWQDVKELLDRGIDVYTTLNVQHIESLNDDVSHIIHAPVRETVPDSLIENADVLELVDCSPEELLERLAEGKVYFPAQAALAKERFFRKGNLTALRELALRVTAERVGSEVLLYRQGEGIQHIWPTREKILVCVGPGLESIKLIRAAKRMATSLQAEWIAVYVETPTLQAVSDKKNSAIRNLRLAEQLGADTRILTGFDIVKEIMRYARDQNVTQIMIWKNVRPRFRDLFFRNLADEILRNSGEIDVYIMTGEEKRKKHVESAPKTLDIPWRAYIASIGIIFLATIINFLLFPYANPNILMMVYLLGITSIALFGEIGPSLLGSVLSVLTYDFFFVTPIYTVIVSERQYLFTLFFMFLLSLAISNLTILTRRFAQSTKFVAHQTAALHTLTRKLASSRGQDDLLNVSVNYLMNNFQSDVMVLLPENGFLVVRAHTGEMTTIDQKEQSVAQWVYELGQQAGIGTTTLPSSDSLYLPLVTSKCVLGVLRIHPYDKERLLTPEQMDLLETCAAQIALSLEVDRLYHEQISRS